MKKEWLNMKVRTISILILMLILFFSLAPFQNLVIDILNKNSETIQKFVGNNLVEKLKNWDYYILTQWFGKNFGQIIPIISIILAFPLFSREFENETMQFLLVRLSRKRVFLNKTLLGLILLITEISLLSYLPYIYSTLANKSLSFQITTKFFLHSLIGGIFWYSLTLIFSVLFNDQVKPILSSLAILGLTTTLGFLKPLSFLNTYKYILGVSIFEQNKVDVNYSLSLILLSIIFLYFSHTLFKEKEV
ncbi:ABC transporter permease [Thermosipho melanesiensis]|uniref:ABC-2 type transport system permease protein n=2 Tax=Thermosipho melanesiensis TaxID=46541 RepID=A6LM35_THEM4|nr:hypothetical protein [Thermosipho melanesiensis]ABR30986.1 hypothetical protein Tmel_1131 [Thermosipho melanesiensis BI429]APT74083.1 hypothetical protein BW47_06055 [Thermosipho melanesiensis]OOC36029.1 ABC transporter permease [Thermosipho melanesiensis]OOC36846.1 ABC transporter permease [Thermosipho melanesiensis]OOC37597.1 ABC transporter permease [Thermosipho melanesiensis]